MISLRVRPVCSAIASSFSIISLGSLTDTTDESPRNFFDEIIGEYIRNIQGNYTKVKIEEIFSFF